jgi:predicted small secreted protein
MMKIVFTLLAAAYVLVGCNTMRGFGQDVQKAGEKIEDSAAKKK